MATTSEASAITVPAEYLEDLRTALVAEIANDSHALSVDQEAVRSAPPEDALRRQAHRGDRDGAMRSLCADVQTLAQLLTATEDARITADGDTLYHTLEAVVKVLSGRLTDECGYAPVDMSAVSKIAGRLQWAAEEAVRIRGRVG